jgi:hypothetical protein
MNATTITGFLEIPMEPIVAVAYVLIKQEAPLLGLEHRDGSRLSQCQS